MYNRVPQDGKDAINCVACSDVRILLPVSREDGDEDTPEQVSSVGVGGMLVTFDN